MHVAARVDHAISAALVLPEPCDEPVGGAALAEQLGLSYPYLMTIMDPLKKAGLARVRRGPHGGLSLARPSTDITIADVIWAVDEPFVPAGTTIVAERSAGRVLPQLWASARGAVRATFTQIRLSEVRGETWARSSTGP